MPKRQCFVVGAIGGANSPERLHADWLLLEVIRPALIEKFEIVRADEIAAPGQIDSQIITRLINWDLVVADLTGLNPNAFYEIGIRHMAIRPIIHMFAQDQALPFDLNHYRAVPFFLGSPMGLAAARSTLAAAADAILAEGFVVENPVTQARGRDAFEAEATPPMKLIQGQLDAVQQRLEYLEITASRRATGASGGMTATGKANAIVATPIGAKAASSASRVVVALANLFGGAAPLILSDNAVLVPVNGVVNITMLEEARNLVSQFGYTVAESTFSP